MLKPEFSFVKMLIVLLIPVIFTSCIKSNDNKTTEGDEVFRHAGYLPENDIQKVLIENGVKI